MPTGGITAGCVGKGGVILNKMKCTGEEVVYIQEVRIRAREDNTLMSFPSLVLCTFSNQPAFFRSYAIHKRFHLVHIQAIVVCVCVCVCVHLCVCAVILVYARKLQKVCHTHMHAQVLTSLITGNCDKVCTAA